MQLRPAMCISFSISDKPFFYSTQAQAHFHLPGNVLLTGRHPSLTQADGASQPSTLQVPPPPPGWPRRRKLRAAPPPRHAPPTGQATILAGKSPVPSHRGPVAARGPQPASHGHHPPQAHSQSIGCLTNGYTAHGQVFFGFESKSHAGLNVAAL